jgi:hypothetical protein
VKSLIPALLAGELLLGQSFLSRFKSWSIDNAKQATMPTHKFKTGQTVFLTASLNVPGGAYVVTRQLPERDGEFLYRVKSAREHERAVREGELSDVPAQSNQLPMPSPPSRVLNTNCQAYGQTINCQTQ